MPRALRAGLDALLPVLLAGCLWLVYRSDRPASEVLVDPPETPASTPQPVRLAVTEGGYDDMGKLLDVLGEGYRFTVVSEDELRDPKACARFDAIFLTCARPKGPEVDKALARSLRTFVDDGGTLYASDLQFDTLAEAFPDVVDPAAVAEGLKQQLRAEVVSPELREVLNGEMPLQFDLDGWRPAAFRGPGVTTHLRGSFQTTAGVTIEAPLLVKFTSGKGTVLFTSFHNEKQNSELETKLLRHLVFSTVTAKVEASVARSMVQGGFSPQQTSLLSAKPGDPSKTLKYEHDRTGGLVFTLGFENRGARLRLEVISPRDKKRVERGTSTLTIAVPDAEKGTWTCVATAESLPYPNFPFTLSVGSSSGDQPPSSQPQSTPQPGRALIAGNVRFKEVVVQQPVAAGPKRIGVITPQKDDMGKLLARLGEGYKFKEVESNDLLRSDALDGFDIFFLTCGGWPGEWGSQFGDSAREGIQAGNPRPEIIRRVGETFRRFTDRGGTLYASDLRHGMLFWAYPSRRAFTTHDAKILDDLAALERSWLSAKAGRDVAGTVAEALGEVELSPALKADLQRLVMGVERSPLVTGNLNESKREAENAMREVRHLNGLPATDEDVQKVAEAMIAWEGSIREAFRAQPKAKRQREQNEVATLEKRLANAREMLDKELRHNPRRLGAGNQVVLASVQDTGLREFLGVSLPLNFNEDSNGWSPAIFRGDDVVEYMRGRYRTIAGTDVGAPLLVKFPEGKGTVIFTSFHNEAQNSRQEELLLKYLVFSAVTAKEQAIADQTMLSGGFSPKTVGLESHSSGQPSVTRTHQATKAGPLRFALTFANEGARLKLTLVAPTGQVYEKEAESTLIVEAEDAPAGEWRYTVTALKVPYENFPYRVSIGEVDRASPETRP
jgi:hypothetical protein